MHVVNHAGWAPCKIDAPACKTPQLYKFALCICNALFTALCSCVDVSRLCTAGVLRDEEESVSPPLSDLGDDWNINGLCRAEHKQCPGTFIEQSRGCGAAMSECEWSKTVLSVTFQTSKTVFGVIWASFWSFYFKFRKILEVEDLKKNPIYSSGLCTTWRCFWPQWKHKKKRKVNDEPLRQQQK